MGHIGVGLARPVHVRQSDAALLAADAHRRGLARVVHLGDHTPGRRAGLERFLVQLRLNLAGENLDLIGPDRSQGAAVPLALVELQQALDQFLLGGLLEFNAHTRGDLKPLGVEGVGAVRGLDVAAHVLREIGDLLDVDVPARFDVEFDVEGLGGLLTRDGALLDHPVQHVDLALPGLVGVTERRIPGRRLGQPGQNGALGQTQVLDPFAEIVLRRRLDPVGPVAEVDLVQVEKKDFLLAEGLFDPVG